MGSSVRLVQKSYTRQLLSIRGNNHQFINSISYLVGNQIAR
jgi:hypothetical protein